MNNEEEEEGEQVQKQISCQQQVFHTSTFCLHAQNISIGKIGVTHYHCVDWDKRCGFKTSVRRRQTFILCSCAESALAPRKQLPSGEERMKQKRNGLFGNDYHCNGIRWGQGLYCYFHAIVIVIAFQLFFFLFWSAAWACLWSADGHAQI